MSENKPKRPFQTHFTGHSLTKPEFTDKVGAKNIIKNVGYQQYITSQHANAEHPVAEWDQETSLHHRYNVVLNLERQFNSFPREVRQKYGTPENMVKVLSDTKNWEEAVRLGVLPKDVIPFKEKTEEQKIEEKVKEKEFEQKVNKKFEEKQKNPASGQGA